MFSPLTMTSPSVLLICLDNPVFLVLVMRYSSVSPSTTFMCLSKAMKVPTIMRPSWMVMRTLKSIHCRNLLRWVVIIFIIDSSHQASASSPTTSSPYNIISSNHNPPLFKFKIPIHHKHALNRHQFTHHSPTLLLQQSNFYLLIAPPHSLVLSPSINSSKATYKVLKE